jgi:hypothetical protein
MEQDHDRTVHRRARGILKGKRLILFVAVVAMISALVILLVAFANSCQMGFADPEGLQWLLGELFVFYPHVGKFSEVLIERGHRHVLSCGGRGD